MSAHLRRALVLALLCILPVRGMATALALIACASDSAYIEHPGPHHGHMGTTAANVVDDHDYVLARDTHQGNVDDSASLCCYQLATATPPAQVLTTKGHVPIYAAVVILRARVHIPELPRRPPRA